MWTNPGLYPRLGHDDVIRWKHCPRYLLAFSVGNSPVSGEFPSKRPVTRSFDVFLDLRLNQQLEMTILLIMKSL